MPRTNQKYEKLKSKLERHGMWDVALEFNTECHLFSRTYTPTGIHDGLMKPVVCVGYMDEDKEVCANKKGELFVAATDSDPLTHNSTLRLDEIADPFSWIPNALDDVHEGKLTGKLLSAVQFFLFMLSKSIDDGLLTTLPDISVLIRTLEAYRGILRVDVRQQSGVHHLRSGSVVDELDDGGDDDNTDDEDASGDENEDDANNSPDLINYAAPDNDEAETEYFEPPVDLSSPPRRPRQAGEEHRDNPETNNARIQDFGTCLEDLRRKVNEEELAKLPPMGDIIACRFDSTSYLGMGIRFGNFNDKALDDRLKGVVLYAMLERRNNIVNAPPTRVILYSPREQRWLWSNKSMKVFGTDRMQREDVDLEEPFKHLAKNDEEFKALVKYYLVLQAASEEGQRSGFTNARVPYKKTFAANVKRMCKRVKTVRTLEQESAPRWEDLPPDNGGEDMSAYVDIRYHTLEDVEANLVQLRNKRANFEREAQELKEKQKHQKGLIDGFNDCIENSHIDEKSREVIQSKISLAESQIACYIEDCANLNAKADKVSAEIRVYHDWEYKLNKKYYMSSSSTDQNSTREHASHSRHGSNSSHLPHVYSAPLRQPNFTPDSAPPQQRHPMTPRQTDPTSAEEQDSPNPRPRVTSSPPKETESTYSQNMDPTTQHQREVSTVKQDDRPTSEQQINSSSPQQKSRLSVGDTFTPVTQVDSSPFHRQETSSGHKRLLSTFSASIDRGEHKRLMWLSTPSSLAGAPRYSPRSSASPAVRDTGPDLDDTPMEGSPH